MLRKSAWSLERDPLRLKAGSRIAPTSPIHHRWTLYWRLQVPSGPLETLGTLHCLGPSNWASFFIPITNSKWRTLSFFMFGPRISTKKNRISLLNQMSNDLPKMTFLTRFQLVSESLNTIHFVWWIALFIPIPKGVEKRVFLTHSSDSPLEDPRFV